MRCGNCLIENGGFTKALVFLPEVLNRDGVDWFDVLNEFLGLLSGTIICNDDFKIGISLCEGTLDRA